MSVQLFFLFLSILMRVASSESNATRPKRYFPQGFFFGVSTSSYQIEGAWNEDGKSESIWDHLTHMKPSAVKDGSTGDDANLSYKLYKRDVETIRELGVSFYRFSLSWPRILPSSFPDKINQQGVDYYNNLINELLEYNIQPMVTLYHWDLPQALQEMGGWTNPLIADWFADYARVAFELFGDRVKYWITINEPELICHFGYANKLMAPMVNVKGVSEYLCAKNVLMAHAKVYHLYDNHYRALQQGVIFISLSSSWYEPESFQHVLAAEETFQFDTGHYAHAIFSKTGDWPLVMKMKIAAKSAEQGYPKSRLPSFTRKEINFIRGSSDFFGLNHYHTFVAYKNSTSTAGYEIPSRDDDLGVGLYKRNEWKYSDEDFVWPVPSGFKKLLIKIMQEYDNPPLIVTENGYSTHGGLKDDRRVKFYREYLNAMLDAMDAGSDIKGFIAWSLVDNFEWTFGYTECFGLYEVNRNSSQRTRTPRKSAFVFKEIVRTLTLDFNYEPNSTVMTIDAEH